MTVRVVELDALPAAERELSALGCDRAGVRLMAPKSVFRAVRAKALRPAAANILKQEMLSFGGEAATAYGSIDHSVAATDVLICGTLKQFRLLTEKLKQHQFGLPALAAEIAAALAAYDRAPAPLKVGPLTLDFGLRTYIMGILNVTPDSFSDGGRYLAPAAALARAEELSEAGADIIDIGGESTRPGAAPLPAAEELERVIPVIKALARRRGLALSIDTRKAAVARRALEAGAHLVNDVSGLRFDKKMAGVLAQDRVPVCLMHMKGTPKTMQKKPVYNDLLGEIITGLSESIAIANNAGILLEKIIVDPGFGFGKTAAHNLEIAARLRELKVLGRPILLGPSRKSTIGRVLSLPPEERVEGTAACVALAISGGANLVRVHDVRAISRVVRMTDAIVRRERSW
ncbi:MAG: dihydropteroate synthase [Candidatus Saganbacteria bacterium]|nr:dihydropteroate synthase [Candidatus Saganbacteria bacterium]